tara:strand:+ start:610 stop:864 length:255 start_codon:yes stop_codon:yes gene_type:complete
MTLTKPRQIEAYRLLALKGALKLQALGMRRRGKSALSLVRSATGLKARNAEKMIPLYEDWLRDAGILFDAPKEKSAVAPPSEAT